MRTTNSGRYVLPLVQAAIGLVWLRAGIEKLQSGTFVAGMGKTLGHFASKNPNGWYRDFLTSFAIPNHQAFGYLIMYGEALVGVTLLATAAFALVSREGIAQRLSVVATAGGLLGGAMMSWNYYFASGWTSPSSETVNYALGLIQLALLTGAVATLVAIVRTTGARQERTHRVAA